MLIKRLVVAAALCFSSLAVARMAPIFGVARYGEAQLGDIAVPVSFMPLWAILLLAAALWFMDYQLRTKDRK